MGFIFRKSVNFGPLRVNFSRSGVGYSVGAGGFRTGVRANGRRYTRVSVPGTGLGYQHNHARSSTGCAVAAIMIGSAAVGTAALAIIPLLS